MTKIFDVDDLAKAGPECMAKLRQQSPALEQRDRTASFATASQASPPILKPPHAAEGIGC